MKTMTWAAILIVFIVILIAIILGGASGLKGQVLQGTANNPYVNETGK